MTNFLFSLSTLSLALILFFSCRSKLDNINPNNIITINYNTNTDELTKSINGVYAVLQSPGLIGRNWYLLQTLRADESIINGSLEPAYYQIYNGNLEQNNALVTDIWKACYSLIFRANSVIKDATYTVGEEKLKNRLVGEARFLRAWTYFQLVTMWGKVPLYETVPSALNFGNKKSSVNEINEFIIDDLKYAEEVLDINYTGNDIGRATKAAAQSLLGWVYLQMLDYTLAKEEFKKVITSNNYVLVDNYIDNFLEETEYNKESIFEVGFNDSDGYFGWGNNLGDGKYIGETTTRNQDYNATTWRSFTPSDKILAEFENIKAGDSKTDPRLNDNIYFSGDTYNNNLDTLSQWDQKGNYSNYYGEIIKASWKKYTITYKSDASFYPAGINYRMIRYGMVLLMMAECEIELGNIDAGIGYLNQLRNRASVKMPEYPTSKFPCTTKEEAFEAMMHEKLVETAGEDIRNFDIIRWRKANKFTIEPIYNYTSNLALLPIPYEEMKNNPNIESQNPGY